MHTQLSAREALARNSEPQLGRPDPAVPAASRGDAWPAFLHRILDATRSRSRAFHTRSSIFDSVLAVLLCAAALGGLAVRSSSADIAEIALVCLGALCLIWRRLAPVAVFAVCAASYCGYKALGHDYSMLLLALLIALYTLASTSASSVAATALCALVVGASSADVMGTGWPPRDFDDRIIAYLLAMSAACALGYGVQLTRARTELLRRQALRLSKEHALHEEQLLHQQQNRIARELHDVVAHQVSVITALAAGARRVFDAEPDRARDALTSIEAAGRDALIEMRRLLRVLHTDQPADLLVPQPGIADIPALAAQIEAAGLPVELLVTGERWPLPAGVELCAYRIVQEALTNALRYAGPASTSVRLGYRQDGMELTIRDNGRGIAAAPGSGQGLAGMRERAMMLGGWLAVSAVPGGGVQVRAFLPVGAPCPDAVPPGPPRPP